MFGIPVNIASNMSHSWCLSGQVVCCGHFGVAQGYGLYVSPQNSDVEILTLNVIVLGRALGGKSVIRVEPLWWDLCRLQEEKGESLLFSLTMRGYEKITISKPDPVTGSASTLVLSFSASRTMGNKCLSFKSLRLWCSLQRPELAKTHWPGFKFFFF